MSNEFIINFCFASSYCSLINSCISDDNLKKFWLKFSVLMMVITILLAW